jgi:hypothetical protein
VSESGELLTRLTIWSALFAAAIGAWRQSRRAWTLGCAALIAHIACAFAFTHDWSHDDAYRETARQTAALTGLDWGGGIYFNYLFAAAWLADVSTWWLAAEVRARSPRWLTPLWRGFFLFMVFNGAVVFIHGPARWLGLVISIVLAWAWWREARIAPSRADG